VKPRIAALAVSLLLAACAGRRHLTGRKPGDETAFATVPDVAPFLCRARGRGAAPGGERGPGGFVPRADARSFYAAAGGQLWYYLNLYYWAPLGVDPEDLWIRAEVVEELQDLRRWPDATPANGPAPKTTVEYWAVGASGRTTTIDNHKDFFLASEGWCAGAIDVRITLEVGRLRVRDAKGAWERPTARYVLERRSYGTKPGIGSANARFEPLTEEPSNVWAYRIPWSTFPAKLVRSAWEGLVVPELRLVRSSAPTPRARPAVLTAER
jgi:hypothetical protein